MHCKNQRPQNHKITSQDLSGDFFFYPAEKVADLETALAGVALDQAQAAIEAFYHAEQIESPGVTPRDLAVAVGAAEREG